MLRKLIVLAAVTILLPGRCFAQEKKPAVEFFFSASCHICSKIKADFLPQIQKDFAAQAEFVFLDISEIENYKKLLGYKDAMHPEGKVIVPSIVVGDNFMQGEEEIRARLASAIQQACGKGGAAAATPIDLISRFLSFGVLTIIAAGLIDGVNPCAFTVIVFFISFLALQGYKKRQLVIIGVSFILAVFITYLLIGVGLFAFLYRVKGVWIVSRLLNYGIGAFSLVLGVLALIDLVRFKKSGGQTAGLTLQLPKTVKERIHKVIGAHYRGKDNAAAANGSIVFLVVNAVITGFLVSLLEAVCTGQAYLPTITFVLKISHLKLQAAWYLLLYNLMFILPLAVILFLAVAGVSSAQFAGFLKKRMTAVKLLMGLMFIFFGLFLMWRA